MKNGALTFYLTGLVVVTAGLVAAPYWYWSFKIELAIIIVACLLAGYLAGERRTR